MTITTLLRYLQGVELDSEGEAKQADEDSDYEGSSKKRKRGKKRKQKEGSVSSGKNKKKKKRKKADSDLSDPEVEASIVSVYVAGLRIRSIFGRIRILQSKILKPDPDPAFLQKHIFPVPHIFCMVYDKKN